MSAPPPAHPHPLVKLGLEIGPLAVFFLANARWGIFAGAGASMAAMALALAASYLLVRKVPTLPLVTAAFVLVFGGLTLALQDELFIKVKPTVVNGLFALILFGGLAFGRPLLKPLLDGVFPLTDAGWTALTRRWAWFFVLLAVLNELVWRHVATDTWIAFKLFGIVPLSLAFGLAQLPLLRRHALPAAGEESW